MRTKKKTCVLVAGLILATVGVAFAAFFQSFETDTNGWFSPTRVMSGTHGVLSESGAFHAEDTPSGSFTRWGGYGKTFPPRRVHHDGGYLSRHFAALHERHLDAIP